MRIGPAGRIGLIGFLILLLAFLYSPIVMVGIAAVNVNRLTALPWRGFTLDWFSQIPYQPGLLDSLGNSLVVAAAVALTSTTLGFLAAYSLRDHGFRGQGAILALLTTPLAVPWVLLGLSLLLLFNAIGIPAGLLSVWLGHTTIAAPLALMTIRPRLNALSSSFEEAASDLGAGQLKTLWEVLLPMSWPALLASLLLTFTVSFDEFIIAWFVSGFSPTLPVQIWTSLRSGINPSISAISLLVLALSIALGAAAARLARPSRAGG
jgi:spermidine/putrescine transport system permease protein